MLFRRNSGSGTLPKTVREPNDQIVFLMREGQLFNVSNAAHQLLDGMRFEDVGLGSDP